MAAPRLSLVKTPGAAGAGDDAAMVAALVGRAPGAEREAWRRLRPLVEGTLRRTMGPGEDVADLSQEVFLRFFRGVRRLREAGAVRGFVVGICLHVVRREIRKRWVRRWLRLTPDGEPPEQETAQETAIDLESRDVLRRYYALLERIGGEARSLFVAREIEELPMADVAALHGLSISTTQRRLRRVVRRVAAMVAADPVLAAYLRARRAGGGDEP